MIKLNDELLSIVGIVISEYEDAYGSVEVEGLAPFVEFGWAFEYEVYAFVNWMLTAGIVADNLAELEEMHGRTWVWKPDST